MEEPTCEAAGVSQNEVGDSRDHYHGICTGPYGLLLRDIDELRKEILCNHNVFMTKDYTICMNMTISLSKRVTTM